MESSSISSHHHAHSRINHLLSHINPSSSSRSLLSSSPVSNKKNQDESIQSGGLEAAYALLEQHISYVFTLTGGHIAPILVGCNSVGIKVIDVRDEVTTVFAADAVARLTGIPGVAIVTAGPGLTNTITAVKNAQLAQSPVIIFAGATAILLKGRGSLQDIDQFALMKPHVKACFTIKTVKDIRSIIRKSFNIAKQGVPGPVFVEYPLDTIWPKDIICQQFGIRDSIDWPSITNFSRAALSKSLEQWYLKRHINTVFDGAFTQSYPKLLLSDQQLIPLYPDAYQVSIIASQLLSSLRPVFIIGSQAVRANDISSIIQSLTILSCPVYLSGMARGLLGKSHPLQYRHKRTNALQKADFVLLLGVPADFRLEYGRHIGKNAYFTTVNLCSITLKKNNDMRSPNEKVHADSIVFLSQLSQLIIKKTKQSSQPDRRLWIDYLNQLQTQREKEINDMMEKERRPEVDDDEKNFLSPLYLCKELDKVIDDNSIIIADGGDFVGTASYIIRPRSPLSWLDPGVFGTLGVGAGFALGAKLIRPESEIWCIYGDGSVGWSLSEFDTYCRFHIPIIAIIGNDACWSQMYRDQIKYLKNPIATELSYTRYDRVVEGFGAKGLIIRKESEIPIVLKKAKEIAKTGQPVLINCMIVKSGFREGSVSL